MPKATWADLTPDDIAEGLAFGEGLKYRVEVRTLGLTDLHFTYWAMRCAVLASGAVVLESAKLGSGNAAEGHAPVGELFDKVVLNGHITTVKKILEEKS